MNNNEYKTWTVLLNNPNKWLDVMEVAYLTNLTRRQVSSILSARITDPHLEHGFNKAYHMPTVRMAADESALSEMRKQVITDFYHITPAMKE